MPRKKKVAEVRYRKKRGRPAMKRIALGGSYPIRGQGQIGRGGVPYFVTRDPEPKEQVVPTKELSAKEKELNDLILDAKLAEKKREITHQDSKRAKDYYNRAAIGVGLVGLAGTSVVAAVKWGGKVRDMWDPAGAAQRKGAAEVNEKVNRMKGKIDAVNVLVSDFTGVDVKENVQNAFKRNQTTNNKPQQLPQDQKPAYALKMHGPDPIPDNWIPAPTGPENIPDNWIPIPTGPARKGEYGYLRGSILNGDITSYGFDQIEVQGVTLAGVQNVKIPDFTEAYGQMCPTAGAFRLPNGNTILTDAPPPGYRLGPDGAFHNESKVSERGNWVFNRPKGKTGPQKAQELYSAGYSLLRGMVNIAASPDSIDTPLTAQIL